MGTPSACLFEGGGVYDLNDLLPEGSGWQLRSAVDINDAGQIVGYGLFNGVGDTAFLLTPIPEPATLSLLALGTLAVLRRRRK